MKNKILRISIVAVLITAITGCESFLDVNENPNNPTKANIDLLFPNAIAGAGFWTARTANENAGIFARQFYNLNESTYNIQGNLTDTEFDQIYADPLKDFAQVIQDAEARGLEGYAGISKVMTAYLFSVLTDLWGDVPYSEALKGETILNAKFDDDRDIYNGLLVDLDEAIADLQKAAEESEVVVGDLIYGDSDGAEEQFQRWIRAANTLKLKLLLNMRLVDPNRARTEITKLVTDNMLISSNEEDFEFLFGSSGAPVNRHPIYQQEYLAGNKVFYMSNYLMYTMLVKEDPRIRYYIYRQGTNSELDFQTEPCAQRTDCIYWPLLEDLPEGDGYIGREHGDPSGLPADNTIRATWGVYPIGGTYDNDQRAERIVTSGTGAGVMPWITNSMRAFMVAEAALTLGTPGDPKDLLIKGVKASMEKVTEFSASIDESAPSPSDPDLKDAIDAYVALVSDTYDNTTNNAQKLDVIIKEKYFAEFGNGVEAYNDYRRTGFPSDLPASLAPSGPFPLRFPLGPTELTSNPNAPNPAPLVSEPVFWDVN
jgi:hypothetical protein